MGLIRQADGTGTQTYVLGDGLGSSTVLTDGAGAVTATYAYDVFGALRSSTGTGATEFRFTGQQQDASTGLTFLRARYYDPATGRFLSKARMSGFLAALTTANW